MKHRHFAYGAINQVGFLFVGIIQRSNVCFNGPGRFRWDIGDRCMESLAADHQEFVLVHDGTGSPDGVFELLPVHRVLLNDR